MELDVVVTGGQLADLTVALECAAVGLRVHVIIDEALAEAEITRLETTALQGELDPDCAIAELIERVARPFSETARPEFNAVTNMPAKQYLWAADKWLPVPEVSVLGVPSSPLAKDVTKLVGQSAAFRAYLDRIKPLLTIGKERHLAELVTSRVGAKVLATIVDPLTNAAYGAAASDIDVAVILPGLNETMTRVGSLTGAVLAYQDRWQKERSIVAPSCGWADFRRRFLKKLELLNVSFSSHETGGAAAQKGAAGAPEAAEAHEAADAHDTAEAHEEAETPESLIAASRAVVEGVDSLSAVAGAVTRARLTFCIEKPQGLGGAANEVAIKTVGVVAKTQGSLIVESSPTRATASLVTGVITPEILLQTAELQAQMEQLLQAEMQALKLVPLDKTVPQIQFVPPTPYSEATKNSGLASEISAAVQKAIEVRRELIDLN